MFFVFHSSVVKTESWIMWWTSAHRDENKIHLLICMWHIHVGCLHPTTVIFSQGRVFFSHKDKIQMDFICAFVYLKWSHIGAWSSLLYFCNFLTVCKSWNMWMFPLSGISDVVGDNRAKRKQRRITLQSYPLQYPYNTPTISAHGNYGKVMVKETRYG